MNSICVNGVLLPHDHPAIMVDNRGYRYGDGIFETMRMERGSIRLGNYHFERLFSGLSELQFDIPPVFNTPALEEQILRLCEMNRCIEHARIRLSVSRGSGGLFDVPGDLQYAIECNPLTEANLSFNERGLSIDVFADSRKSCDKFSSLKSANFLPYVMAARYARSQQLDECVVLNMHDRIADSCTANIFVCKDGHLFTPPLSEGCVDGVMRRHVIGRRFVQQKQLTVPDLINAEEVFLTNAVSGIRWVQSFRGKVYSNEYACSLYSEIFQTI